jgi:hypothetical protein
VRLLAAWPCSRSLLSLSLSLPIFFSERKNILLTSFIYLCAVIVDGVVRVRWPNRRPTAIISIQCSDSHLQLHRPLYFQFD